MGYNYKSNVKMRHS